MYKKPKIKLQTTTLWDYPSQHYGDTIQGDQNYKGATPSYIIWNLLQRYTKPDDIVLDPMCGSGTTLDVCKDLHRKGIGFDIAPYRDDIQKADARHLPLKSNSVDFVFVDPPYSNHIKYSDDYRCIGKLSAFEPEYYKAMEQVISEIHRVLKPTSYMAILICDFFKYKKGFCPVGFEIFNILRKKFIPIDIICVHRRSGTLFRKNWHNEAIKRNFFLREFNYLFIMQKSRSK